MNTEFCSHCGHICNGTCSLNDPDLKIEVPYRWIANLEAVIKETMEKLYGEQ